MVRFKSSIAPYTYLGFNSSLALFVTIKIEVRINKKDLRLLAVVDGEALQEQAAETRPSAAAARVEDPARNLLSNGVRLRDARWAVATSHVHVSQ